MEIAGVILSSVGLAVSLGGFYFAIRQIIRSRSAAEAATQAVVDTRESLAKNLTVADLNRASERLQQLKDRHLGGEWRLALDQYHDIRVMLSDIRARHPGLAEAQSAAIQEATTQLSVIENQV